MLQIPIHTNLLTKHSLWLRKHRMLLNKAMLMTIERVVVGEEGVHIHNKDVASTWKIQAVLGLSFFMPDTTLHSFAESPWALQTVKQVLPLIASLPSFQ